MSTPRFPTVKVRLTGTDGNAYAILGKVSAALRKNGVSEREVRAFNDEAMSGDYDQLLITCTQWVEVS